MMRLVILTTGAVRRRYFVENLQKKFAVFRVLIETRNSTPLIPTQHPLDEARKEQERNFWYAGAPPKFNQIANVRSFENLNQPDAVEYLKKVNPDVTLVFGTGKLGNDILQCCGENLFNFHNGDPESYRGLDCHLWPIYHKDFSALKMTLHKIDATLDTGDIIDRRPINIHHNMPLFDFRRVATELAVAMGISALSGIEQNGCITGFQQQQIGRYYSHMPAVLKDLCVRHFGRYTRTL